VPEDTELKLAIFGKLDGICPPPAVLSVAARVFSGQLMPALGATMI
jgi:3-hydroxyacyl-CoA dehydrogenase